MADTMKALQTVTVGAGGAASITFSSIPNNYTDLVIKLSGRGTKAATYASVVVGFNGDTSVGNQPQITELAAIGNSVVNYGPAVGAMAYINASTSTSNTFSNCDIYISDYNNQFFKLFLSDSTTENNATSALADLLAGIWRYWSPISSIVLQPDTGSFAQYSTATLYGVFNADVSTAPSTPTIGTATAGVSSASITFTGGANAASYTMTSSPGGFTATGSTSPITVTGLTVGTPYTFTVKANNPFGSSGQSSASNSVTPVSYSSVVLADNPRGFWLMNETSGSTFADTSGQGNNATIFNSPTLNQSGPLSGLNKSVLFNGTTQYGKTSLVSTFAINPSANWSVEGWFKATTSQLGAVMYVGDDSGGSGGMLMQMGLSSLNKAFITIITNTPGFLTISSTTNFNDGAWHHLAATSVSGGAVTLYVDGVSVASTSTARRASALNSAVIIGSQVGQYFFNGNITAAAVYNTTLSAARVLAHYNTGR